ncbi:EamA family transporter [Candidatus Bathyarchaeota archaeon]|nr:EamA family transporter [Candidatus Bathyarchaeota archaeon]
MIVRSAVCWAIYTVLSKSVLARYRPMAVTILSICIGTSFLLMIALAVEDLSGFRESQLRSGGDNPLPRALLPWSDLSTVV